MVQDVPGYLACKKTHLPRAPTAGPCLGSSGGPRWVGACLWSKYPYRGADGPTLKVDGPASGSASEGGEAAFDVALVQDVPRFRR